MTLRTQYLYSIRLHDFLSSLLLLAIAFKVLLLLLALEPQLQFALNVAISGSLGSFTLWMAIQTKQWKFKIWHFLTVLVLWADLIPQINKGLLFLLIQAGILCISCCCNWFVRRQIRQALNYAYI